MSLPAWWDKAERRDRNARSKKQEKKIARRTGGRVQAGSGSSWRRPQDVVEEGHVVQAKFTDKPSFTISMKEWAGIRKDAYALGRSPKMEIEFQKHKVKLVITEEPYE